MVVTRSSVGSLALGKTSMRRDRADSAAADGQKIRKLRLGKGWKRKELAEVSHVSMSTLARAERGKQLRANILVEIATALDVQAKDIMRAGDDRLPESSENAQDTQVDPSGWRDSADSARVEAATPPQGASSRRRFSALRILAFGAVIAVTIVTVFVSQLYDRTNTSPPRSGPDSIFELPSILELLSDRSVSIDDQVLNHRIVELSHSLVPLEPNRTEAYEAPLSAERGLLLSALVTSRGGLGGIGGEANFSHADLARVKLDDADLSDGALQGARLRDSDLIGTILARAHLERADTRGTDLRGANLRAAKLNYADLRYANLSGADLCGADLEHAILTSVKASPEQLRCARNWETVVYSEALAEQLGLNSEDIATNLDQWVTQHFNRALAAGLGSVAAARPGDAECCDRQDNDGDGLVDSKDPGCQSSQDNNEGDGTTACQNGVDDDLDGYLDFPNDVECYCPHDNNEWPMDRSIFLD